MPARACPGSHSRYGNTLRSIPSQQGDRQQRQPQPGVLLFRERLSRINLAGLLLALLAIALLAWA